MHSGNVIVSDINAIHIRTWIILSIRHMTIDYLNGVVGVTHFAAINIVLRSMALSEASREVMDSGSSDHGMSRYASVIMNLNRW